MRMLIFISCLLGFLSCGIKQTQVFKNETLNNTQRDFVFDTNFVAHKFRNPVGRPAGKGYYDAQPFMKNTHLGEDWNGNGGGNSDLGDTIYACADGYIKFAEDIRGGWGNVIRIVHQLPEGSRYKQVESLYAHCDTIFVKADAYVRMGDPIGTIGTNHGSYYAHLHFEMRHNILLDIGGGYSMDTTGYLNPKKFISGFNASTVY